MQLGKSFLCKEKRLQRKAGCSCKEGRGRLTNGDNDFEKQLVSDSESRSSKPSKLPPWKWQRLSPASAERAPRGQSLFNYTRRRLPPLNNPIPQAGSNICGSALLGHRGEGDSRSSPAGAFSHQPWSSFYSLANRHGIKCIYQATSLHPRKSPWWLSKCVIVAIIIIITRRRRSLLKSS